MTKRILSLLSLAFSLMHLLATIIFLIRFQTLKPQSLFLGTTFLILSLWLYKDSKKKQVPYLK